MFAEERDSVKITQVNNTALFVSENTIVHGLDQMNIGSKPVKNKIAAAKKKWTAKPKSKSIEAQLLLKKSRVAQLVQNIKNQISSRKTHQFTPSSQQQLSQSNYRQKNVSLNNGNETHVFLACLYYFPFLKIQVTTPQFYTSVSFLQFSRLQDSFLRGPPALL